MKLCTCKVFGGYTIGYICRICKKPIYTEEQAKEAMTWGDLNKSIDTLLIELEK